MCVNNVPVIELVTKCESYTNTISDAFNDLKSLSFGSDPCGIASYLGRHLEQNKDIKQIMDLARDDIPPRLYAKLRKCQVTSVSVERSFSMLRKTTGEGL